MIQKFLKRRGDLRVARYFYPDRKVEFTNEKVTDVP
jgi:hypothetical protein